MTEVAKHDARGMHAAFHKVISAHAAIAQGIATHAEKHVVMIDENRRKAEQNAAIERGISRQNQ